VCATVETQFGAAATGDARKIHSAMLLLPARYHPPIPRVLSLPVFASLFPFLSVTRPPLAMTLHSITGWPHIPPSVCFLLASSLSVARFSDPFGSVLRFCPSV
jgi:hypothetical protein